MKIVGCPNCGRVTHDAVDHRLCALRFDDARGMSQHERTANGLFAIVVLLLTLATMASLRIPEPVEPRAPGFAPSWSGPKPAAVQLAGVRERKEQ